MVIHHLGFFLSMVQQINSQATPLLWTTNAGGKWVAPADVPIDDNNQIPIDDNAKVPID